MTYRDRVIKVIDIPIKRAVETVSRIVGIPLPPEVSNAMRMPIDPSIPAPLRGVIEDPHVSFCYMRDKDVILFADFPLAMKWYIRSRVGKDDLWKSKPFQQAVGKRLADVGNFFYLRYDPLVKAAYNTLVPLAQWFLGGALRSHLNIDLSHLPTADFLERYLNGVVVTFTVSPTNLEMTTAGPIVDTFFPRGAEAPPKRVKAVVQK